jgi:heat shock protein HslJ
MQRTCLALLAALLTVASCGDSHSRSDHWPAGRTFLSTSVTENAADRPLVGGTRIELRFTTGRLLARAACNYLEADGRIDNHQLVLGPISTTSMGCEQARMAQDSWLSEFLRRRPTWTLSGNDLVLGTPTAQIRLIDRRVADPDRALTGTRWTVVSIISRNGVSSVPSGVEAYLRIDAAGHFEGSTGCAQLSGSAAVHADRITFSTTGDPSPGCTGTATTLASAVLGVLHGEVGYRIEARRLTLTNANGDGLELWTTG